MPATIPDLTTSEWTDDLLDQLRRAVATEQERRYVLRVAPQQAEDLATRYAEATGRHDGDPWTQPTGAHDAYKTGDRVTWNGATYESLRDGNVWDPGTLPSGWKRI